MTRDLVLAAFGFRSLVSHRGGRQSLHDYYFELLRQKQFLKAGMVITPYNDHVRSFLPSRLVGLPPPTLLGYCSRQCHGINYTHNSASLPKSPILNERSSKKPARTSVQEGTVSLPVCMYARRMVDNIEKPLSPEQILKRFTKIFRREMTAVECRAQVISNEATLKANATQPQVPKS
jgi:hypothetical protein